MPAAEMIQWAGKKVVGYFESEGSFIARKATIVGLILPPATDDPMPLLSTMTGSPLFLDCSHRASASQRSPQYSIVFISASRDFSDTERVPNT